MKSRIGSAGFRGGLLLLFLALPGLVLAQPARNRSFGDRSVRNIFGRFDARIAVGPKSWDARRFACESRVTIVDAATGKASTIAVDSVETFYDIRDDGSGRLIVYAGNSQGGVFQGTYYFLGADGRATKIPMDIDGHDMLVEADGVYVMKYVPEKTRFRRNLHLEIHRLDERLEKPVWSWSSRGRFDIEVSTFSSSQSFPDERESVFETAAKRALIYLLSPFDVKYPVKFRWLGRQLRLPANDYIHANTIIRAPNGNLWISARHQDAILELNERSDSVVAWIGGPFAPRSDWRIVGDPLGGFSHQHCPQLRGDELYILDNGNLFDNRTSRVVVYRCDFEKRTLTFLADYPEPNGLHRPTQGSVRVLDDNHILVGWGGLLMRDTVKPQRGVSIFELDTGREVFGFDLDAGRDSYNANSIQGINIQELAGIAFPL